VAAGLLEFVVYKRDLGSGRSWHVHRYVKTASEAAGIAARLNTKRGTMAVARTIWEAMPR
jgi:hypothetical protein